MIELADGKVVVDTELDESGIKDGLGKLGSVVKSGLGVATKAVGAVSAGLSAAATGAVMVGSSFEEGMSKVAAISGASRSELDQLAEKARKWAPVQSLAPPSRQQLWNIWLWLDGKQGIC